MVKNINNVILRNNGREYLNIVQYAEIIKESRRSAAKDKIKDLILEDETRISPNDVAREKEHAKYCMV